jgi:hypothetical protein
MYLAARHAGGGTVRDRIPCAPSSLILSLYTALGLAALSSTPPSKIEIAQGAATAPRPRP